MFEGRSSRAGALTLLLGVGVVLALSGCLMVEVEQEDFTLGENGRGKYAITLYNLKSDGPTPYHQDEDFRTMVRALTSDDYLLDRLRDGVYVQRRSITIENEKLVARETGLFGNPSQVGMMLYPDSTYRRRVSHGLEVVGTNGRVIQDGDSISIRWPKRSRQFNMKMQDKSFEQDPSLVARYKAWKAKKP